MEPPEASSCGGVVVGFEEAERMILRWDATASEEAKEKMIFDGDRDEVDRYLQAVDEIQKAMSSASISDGDERVNSAVRIAMARLADEFRHILRSYTVSADHEVDYDDDNGINISLKDSIQRVDSASSSSSISYRSTSSIPEMDLIPPKAVVDLRLIARPMIASGYSRECSQVYGSVRKSAVDVSFRTLGIEKISIDDVRRPEWAAFEFESRKWIRAAKVCVRILFASEKRLCEQIFEGIGTAVGDACFMEIVKGPALQLLNFAEAISLSNRSPEMLFKILDLHDALRDLLPDIEVVFQSKSANSVRVQAAEMLSRLAEAARGILSEFENAVLRDPSTVPLAGCAIHHLTRRVMNYIIAILNYKQTLIELIMSKPSTDSRYSRDPTTPDMEFTELEGKTPLALHLIWIIMILLFNLEGKSKHYKDASLAHLFMMNNVHYIIQKAKGTQELREMIGDYYLKKLLVKLRRAATDYERATWAGMLYCLRDEGLQVSGSFASGVSKSVLRERLKTFTAMFDELQRTQALWMVPDNQLREELRISISEKLIPAYRSFLGRFRFHIESGKPPENYIKYSVEDLEDAVMDFFGGQVAKQSRAKQIKVEVGQHPTDEKQSKALSLGTEPEIANIRQQPWQSGTLSSLRQAEGPSKMFPEATAQNQRILMQGGMGLTMPPDCREWEMSTKIYLMENEFSELPENLRCPVLKVLFLNRNSRLRKIPHSFFNNMPALHTLNISRTRIKSLPQSLFQLVNLKRLFLNHCELLMKLQPEIGKLINLEILDLEGTWITNLPTEVQHLTNLTCLKLSFDDPMNHRKELLNEVIPGGVLSALACLEELHIDVSPDDKRWNACVVAVASEVCGLTTLNMLKFYFPRVALLSRFNWYNTERESLSFSHFRLTVGQHIKRIMCRTPQDIELEMEQYDRCLKYVNGVGVPEEIKVVLRYATAFFLDRHMDIQTISELGCENMMQLKWCMVGECNEIRAIINGDQTVSCSSSEKNIRPTALEYLHIYRMKKLRSIWEGRVLDNGFTSLKTLTLHTCPQLTTIFTPELLASFSNLEELLVDDCPIITSIVSCYNSEYEATHFLPRLKKISLQYLPALASISNTNGESISSTVEWMSVYCCPNLLRLPINKGNHTSLKKIKGERSWWEALEWTSTQRRSWDDMFVPINACD